VVQHPTTQTLRHRQLCGQERSAERLDAFVTEWNSHAHAFRWSRKSFDKVLAKCETNIAAAAGFGTFPTLRCTKTKTRVTHSGSTQVRFAGSGRVVG
jgi:hypothetical protein